MFSSHMPSKIIPNLHLVRMIGDCNYCTYLHYTLVHHTTQHCTTLHNTHITPHDSLPHQTKLHHPTLHYTKHHCNTTNNTALNYTTQRCTILHFNNNGIYFGAIGIYCFCLCTEFFISPLTGGDSKKMHFQLPGNLYFLPVPVLGKGRLKKILHTGNH